MSACSSAYRSSPACGIAVGIKLESEYKAKIDIQARLVDAKREGEGKKSMEIFDLIAKGYTTVNIKRVLEGGR